MMLRKCYFGVAMRDIIFGGLAIAAVGGGVYFIPMGSSDGAIEYNMAQGQVMAKLMALEPEPGLPFHGEDVSITVPADNIVEFVRESSGHTCRAQVDVVDAKRSSVSVSCGSSASDGAAASTAAAISSLNFAELVHSSLQGRPYDKDKVSAQSSAAILSNLGAMRKDAEKMNEEINDMAEQVELEQPESSDFSDTESVSE
jgi:hypothetical protein